MKLAIVSALALCAVVGCHKPPPPPDPDATFIATTKEWQDQGIAIGGIRADAVRKVCKHSPEIADCPAVLARLPPQ